MCVVCIYIYIYICNPLSLSPTLPNHGKSVCVFETRDLLLKHAIRVPHALAECVCVHVRVGVCVCVCVRDREYVFCAYIC